MDKQRQKFVDEMNRMKEAVEETNSDCLRNDYLKALKKMKRELKQYDNFKKAYVKKKMR